MKISIPKLIEQNDLIRYEVDVYSKHINTTKLYFELDKKYADMMSDSSDAALVGLLLPAMYYGEDIYLEGKVSERLYYNISYQLQKLIQTIMPFLKMINIHTDEIAPNNGLMQQGSECATGFSGGIDSFTTLADYFYNPKCPRSSKITMLTFNNVGSHGSKEKGHELFLKRYNKLEPAAKKIGMPFIKINSNLDDFYESKKLDFQKTAIIRNASVALLLQNKIRKFLYSSTYPYAFLGLNNDKEELAYAEPLVLQMLSNENVEIISIGSEYNRVEKTEIVSNIKDSYEYLDVCTRNEKNRINCSSCVKCLGVLTTFELLGKLELYDKSFDLKKYKKNRSKFLGRVLVHDYPSAKSIYRLSRQKNLHFPLQSYIYYIFYKLKSLIKILKNFLKKAKKIE